jgi:uncharacterized protein YecT (DUF1311 family)
MNEGAVAFLAVFAFLSFQPAAFGQTARIANETTQSIKKHESELNALCGKIKKKMKPSEVAEFEKAQHAWAVFRDLECAFYEKNLMRFNGSQNLALFVRDSLVEERIKQLKEFLESWNE